MPREAVYSYNMACKMDPRAVMPQVNLAMAYARAGSRQKARQHLQRALELEPGNPAANFNLGLPMAEQGQAKQAERHLRSTLKADPQMAQAAYNLGLLLHREHPIEALNLCLRAYELQPNPRYGYTVAYMMEQGGDAPDAAGLLKSITQRWPYYADAYLLWAEIHRKAGETPAALEVLRQASAQRGLSPRDQRRVIDMTRKLKQQAK